ncbi:hypothetical protein PMAYCL1PPCAC_06331, partial [Pristionchus mayeri]
FSEEVQVTLSPSLVPSGVPLVQDAPLSVSSANDAPLTPLTLQQPIEVAEPIVLPEDLEERQDTVVRQTSSSGKLQHILRAHYVGQIENEQKFEAQDAAEPAALPKTPRVSLNELFFAPQQQPPPAAAAAPAAPALPFLYAGYPPYPYGYPYGPYPFAAPASIAAALPAAAAV